ncbi:MAG TPA: hypothetical protein PKE45_21535, partial [Caldilineaceae bacterium]|nr:hypothetical protein [Caldilineaceae bacterium]
MAPIKPELLCERKLVTGALCAAAAHPLLVGRIESAGRLLCNCRHRECHRPAIPDSVIPRTNQFWP